MIASNKSTSNSNKVVILQPGGSTEKLDFKGIVTILNNASQQKALVKMWNPATNEVFFDRQELDFNGGFRYQLQTQQKKVRVENQSQVASITVEFE